MTEEEIIDKIFNEKEFLWNELESSIEEYGYAHCVTEAIRNQWYAIERLVNELNFEKNNGGVTYVQTTKILYSSF